MCQAIKSSTRIEAGFVWDVTARQFGLKIIDLKDLEGAGSTISASVVKGCEHPALAKKFAHYLSVPEKRVSFFEQYHFGSIVKVE